MSKETLFGAAEAANYLGITVSRLRRYRRDDRHKFPPPDRSRPIGWREWPLTRWMGMFVREVAEYSGIPSVQLDWLVVYLAKNFKPSGEYKGYPYYPRLAVASPAAQSDLSRAHSAMLARKELRERQDEARRSRRLAKIAARRAALGVVANDSRPKLFWPASDRTMLARLKRVGGDLMVQVAAFVGGHNRNIGYMIPRPCLEAVLGEDLGRTVTAVDVLTAMLRQAFYLNRWCRKGYGRARSNDCSRYARKDQCLQAAVSIAMECPDLKWGWQVDPITPAYPHVVYFDLPQGQVSFHAQERGEGPEYAGTWAGARDIFPGDAAIPSWADRGLATRRVANPRESETLAMVTQARNGAVHAEAVVPA
jgi:hypothetical protein